MARKSNKQKKASRAAERAASAGRGATRSRLAGVAERVTEVLVGDANQSVAPGAYQQIFRYSQLAVGDAGKTRSINDIWATFLDDMATQGMPRDTIARLESLGGKTVLNSDGFSKAITASMDADTLKAVKESHRLAKAAVRGIKDPKLSLSWGELLDDFAKEPEFADANGKRILAELRKLNPKTVARVGSNQALSVVARRGEDPFWVRQFNKLFKRQGTAALPTKMVQMLKETNKGVLPKVEKGVVAALAKASPGVTKGALTGGVGRKAVGLLGKGPFGAAGTGLFLGLEAHRIGGILGRKGRADKLALEGFQGLGPSSSVDFLRNVVDQQEQVARRKTTMQRFEPSMFDEVVRILADTSQQPNSLTSTERRIGSDAQMGVQRRGRSGEDVQFLLDQLFTQMGNPGGQ
ncbi:hypothetical protein LCGC14_0455390 [marine sediment metagenome]|uniref:Uncharacterized protein n=1 Tax=marine sediment metagenome TaxID=412755 RepID=A0A0F9SGR2_9ZZZZ